MKISVSIDQATAIADGIWMSDVPPSNISQLGTVIQGFGTTSVVLLDAPSYDPASHRLSFAINGAKVLNLGSTDRTILLAADHPLTEEVATPNGSSQNQNDEPATRLALGDRQLLKAIEHFPPAMRTAIVAILEHVRKLDPTGDFQRAQNRWVNRPDNFVAIEPQTRKQQLLINIRGIVSTQLPTLSTLNGYTAFKLAAPADLDDVLAAIGSATRKGR